MAFGAAMVPAGLIARASTSPVREDAIRAAVADARGMDVKSIDVQVVADLFLLMLIGIGPKIALVPFLELTDGMDSATKALVARKMLTTAAVVAVCLIALGEILRKLLHFSTGALAIAGGIILLVISASMILRSHEPETEGGGAKTRDPRRLAVFPLAVPYLLNPTGIVVLVVISAETRSVATFGPAMGLLAAVLAIDVVVSGGRTRSATTWMPTACS